MKTLRLESYQVPKIMIEERRLSLLLAKDGRKICAYCPELDLVTELETQEEAIEDMLEAIKEYAQEYMEDFQLYSKSPNRAHHLPYIKAILSCKNDWDIRKFLEIRYGSIHI